MNAPSVDTSRTLSDDNVVRFEPQERPTPPTTIEALMFGLRRGLSCLGDSGNCDRLRRCDEGAIRQIATRLLAIGWLEDEAARLIEAWQAIGGGQP